MVKAFDDILELFRLKKFSTPRSVSATQKDAEDEPEPLSKICYVVNVVIIISLIVLILFVAEKAMGKEIVPTAIRDFGSSALASAKEFASSLPSPLS